MAEIEREAMEYDVVIVGAGPAGLSAAIACLGGEKMVKKRWLTAVGP